MKRLIKYILIIVLACLYNSGIGQESSYEIWKNPDTDDFSLIQQQAENYFIDKDKDQSPGYKQWKRWEYWNERRLSPDGKITNFTRQNWDAYLGYLDNNPQYKDPESTDVTNGSWNFIAATDYVQGYGSSPGIGRVNCIAFHPTNPNIFYIGMPSGGLWKTTNGGETWTCLIDGMPSIGVSGIVVHPTSPNTIFILTGDGDGSDTYSIGVMKTINEGETWNFTGLEWGIQDFAGAYKLIMHPNSSSILFAVTTEGVFKTSNGGSSWSLVIEGSCEDLEFKPSDPTTMYATGDYQFYRSTNTGDNWDIISSGVPEYFRRIAIGVTPANPNYVYLLAGPATGDGIFKGLYRSTNSGLSFTLQSNTPNILGSSLTGSNNSDQCWYDLAVAISRTDASQILTGGINTWVSNDFGVSWSITSYKNTPNSIGYTHADIHALEINPLNNNLYCGSDGGIFKSTDFGDNWTDLSSGIGNTQFYRIAGTESNFNLIIGGTQDNGPNKWTGGSSMEHMYSKDGMDCMVDHSNSDILYYCTQYGDMRKSTDGGASCNGIKPDTAIGSWITPYIMDPLDANTIYAGYNDVYKSINGGSTWINTGVCGHNAIAMGTSNTNWIYATNGGDFHRSDNGAASWTTLDTPDSRSLTFIAVDPGNPLRIFVTVGNYSDGEKVYRSTNGGVSWTNISGSLPNVPVNCIAYENGPLDALYIGTDIGVFYRNNDIGDWIPFMNGLPTVRIMDLEINNTYNLIRAGTYGRGLWSSPLYTECPTEYVLTPLNDPSNPNYTGFQYYEASSVITSSRIITGGSGTDVTYKAGLRVSLIPGFHAKAGNKFKAHLGPCVAGISENSPKTNANKKIE